MKNLNVFRYLVILGVAAAVCRAEVNDEETAAMAAAVSECSFVKPASPRKLLVIHRCDGFRHSSIPYANKMIELMAERTGAFEATFSDGLEVLDKKNLARFDGILLNNTTCLKFETQAQRAALVSFVREGKGLAGIHAASDNFYDFPEAADMLGGQFDGHPWLAGGTWGMKIDEPGHPLVAAFDKDTFEIRDEIYQIKGPYSRSTQRVLISLNMSHLTTAAQNGQKRSDKDNPVAWIKRHGKGRVFYSSLGHNHDVFWNKPVVAHYLAGIQYVLGDLKVEDCPSTKDETGK